MSNNERHEKARNGKEKPFNRDIQDIHDKKDRFAMKNMKKLKFKIISLSMSKDKQAVASIFMFFMVKSICLFFVCFVCFVVKKDFYVPLCL